MPIPEDITEEQILEWDKKFTKETGLPPSWKGFREVFRAGEWLWDKLEENGASEEIREEIVFAAGQMIRGCKDVWAVAQKSYDRYKSGEGYEKPGPELAEKILGGGDQTL